MNGNTDLHFDISDVKSNNTSLNLVLPITPNKIVPDSSQIKISTPNDQPRRISDIRLIGSPLIERPADPVTPLKMPEQEIKEPVRA